MKYSQGKYELVEADGRPQAVIHLQEGEKGVLEMVEVYPGDSMLHFSDEIVLYVDGKEIGREPRTVPTTQPIHDFQKLGYPRILGDYTDDQLDIVSSVLRCPKEELVLARDLERDYRQESL